MLFIKAVAGLNCDKFLCAELFILESKLQHEYDIHLQFSHLNWQPSSTFIENNVTKDLDVEKASSQVDNIFRCEEIHTDIMELVIYEDRLFFSI